MYGLMIGWLRFRIVEIMFRIQKNLHMACLRDQSLES